MFYGFEKKKKKKLVSAVGDASFNEKYPREKPSPSGVGVVAGPPVSGGSVGGGVGGGVAKKSVSETAFESDESSSSDDDDPQAWGLCRFIRSFLYIPSVVRGEEDDYGKEPWSKLFVVLKVLKRCRNYWFQL